MPEIADGDAIECICASVRAAAALVSSSRVNSTHRAPDLRQAWGDQLAAACAVHTVQPTT